jgi:ATP-dependent Clp protease protease subunit
MSLEDPAATWPPWPPEVPPLRPPERPEPQPVLPSWREPEPAGLDRDVADRLLEQRVIAVCGRLDDSVASRVAAQLPLLDARETTPIALHPACTDADLEPSLALAGAVELVESLVLLSPQFSGERTAAVLATLADQHERQVAHLRDLIVRATGRTTQEVAADLDPGRVLGADEAKECGLSNHLL